MKLSWEQVDEVIERALAEDLSQGDVTTELLVPPNQLGRACILAKSVGVLAGVLVAKRVFLKIDPRLEIKILREDGDKIGPQDKIADIFGSVSAILKAERTVLNFLQHLSGIASETAEYVARVEGLAVDIMDTRKTLPGLRGLEKYAVTVGGGKNHRFHLGDGILIKDNHLAALRALGMSLGEIVAMAKRKAPKGLEVEVEVTSAEEALEAAEGGADVIMLDNMKPAEMQKVVALLPGQLKTEASGGITLGDLRQVAETGVSRVSIGVLTHSARALDLSLELEPQTLRLL